MATERSARTPPLRNKSPKSSFHRRSPAATQPDGVSSSARIARQAARPWWRRGGAFGSRKLGWKLACCSNAVRRPANASKARGFGGTKAPICAVTSPGYGVLLRS